MALCGTALLVGCSGGKDESHGPKHVILISMDTWHADTMTNVAMHFAST